MKFVSFWFIVIAVLWTGFMILEGFDFGVGMLHGPVGRDEPGRRAAINTIGPLWDGNEVWLIVAAAAMFAAFPGWYATMFSGFYLGVLALLAALIVRGVSFEYRGKSEAVRWRRGWDFLMTAGSLLAPLLIGIGLGDLLHGVPINARQEFTGSVADLLQPYALLVGVTFMALSALHGATFLALKTTGDVRHRARRLAGRIAPVTALAVLAFATWTHVSSGKGVLLNPVEFAAVVAVLASAWLVYDRHEGWAFFATTLAMASCVLSVFVDLYPRVMVSSTSPAFDLTVHNTASGLYSLKVMTVVVLFFMPLVLLYQAWSYHVFRRRISDQLFRPPPPPPPPQAAAVPGQRAAAGAVQGAPPGRRALRLPRLRGRGQRG